MKINSKILSLLLAPAIFVGCSEDLASEMTPGDNTTVASTLNVTISNIDTKVSLEDKDSKINVDWKDGDAISIFNSADSYVCEFTYNATTEVFESATSLESGDYTATYPATETLDDRGDFSSLTQSQDSSMAHLEDVIRLSGDFSFDTSASDNKLIFGHDMALMKMSFKPSEAKIPQSITFTNGDEGLYTLAFEDITEAVETYVSYIMIDACEAVSRTLSYDIDYGNGDIESYKVNSAKAFNAGTCYVAPVEALSIYAPAEVTISTPSATYCATRDNGFQIEYEVTKASTLNTDITWESEDENIATVDDKGYVTIEGGYGAATINALSDGKVVAIHNFTVPGGWWIEDYSTKEASGSNYLFAINANTNIPTDEGYLSVELTNAQKYTKSVTVNNVAHNLDNCYRADMWCMDEAACVLNANTYPIFAFHIDNNVAKNNVVYQEFELNFTYPSDNNIIKNINTSNDYGNETDSRVSVEYFNDGTMMLIYDMSKFGKAIISSDLTTEASSYLEAKSLSINHFVYGYDNDTEIDGTTYKAMSAFTFNMYNFQTFASADDLATYVNSYRASSTKPSIILSADSSFDTTAYLEDATTTLAATTTDGGAPTSTEWSTSDPLIATVNQNGEVSFCGSGDVTITASSNDYESGEYTFSVTGLSYINGVAQINNDLALQKFINDFNNDDTRGNMPSHDLLLTDDITADASFMYRIYPKNGKSGFYNGTFDGGNHTISGIRNNLTWACYGLIGRSGNGAVIKNLTLKDMNIKCGTQSGGFVGQADADILVYNCHLVDATIASSGFRVGGIVGYGLSTKMSASGTSASIIIGCSVSGNSAISGTYEVGGIAGIQTPVIIGCSNEADITVSHTNGCAGGISGKGGHDSGDIICCYNNGKITSTVAAPYIGGIIGNGANKGFVIDGCFSTAEFDLADGCTSVGGIAGTSFYNINSDCLWVNNATLPTTASSNKTGGTAVAQASKIYTSAKVNALNSQSNKTYSSFVAAGKNWNALSKYGNDNPNKYQFVLNDNTITISGSVNEL